MKELIASNWLLDISKVSKKAVLLYDSSGTMLHANAAAKEMFAGKEDGWNIASMLNRVHAGDQEYVFTEFKKVWRNGVNEDVQFRYSSPQGDVILKVSAYFVDENKFVIFINDVSSTDEKKDFLFELSAKKNTILDTLTHHVSGALSLMTHLSNQAENHLTESDTALARYFNLIKENAKECLVVINDFVDYEYRKTADIMVSLVRMDVVKKISGFVEQLSINRHDRIIIISSSEDEILVPTDEVKLLQIIHNLLSNALKFSESGSIVNVEIRNMKAEVLVIISDQGIGIPNSMKAFVFERDSRAGRAGLNGEPSFGRGLSISKRLAEAIRAKLWFESEEGRGTTFYISLPYHPEKN